MNADVDMRSSRGEDDLPLLRGGLRRAGQGRRGRRRLPSAATPTIRPISASSAPRARRSARRWAWTAACFIPRSAGKRAGWDDGARPRRRAASPRRSREHGPDCGRLLRLRPAADRGLLRRQQADEGLHRLRQHRHQFAAVHGVVGRRPSPRLRRGHRAGSYEDLEQADLVVLVGSNTAWCHPILYQRLLAARAEARHEDRRDRSAPHRDRRRMRPASGARSGHRRAAVQRPARASCPQPAASTPASSREALSGFEADCGARRRPMRPTVERVAQGCGLTPPTCASSTNCSRRRTRTVTVYSQGVNQSAHGTDKVNAIINCHLATGRIGKPGHGAVLGHRPAQCDGRARGRRPCQPACRAYGLREPGRRRPRRAASGRRRTSPRRGGLKAVDLFQAVGDGRIKALWIMGTNPAVSMPDAGTRPRGAEGLRLRRRLRRHPHRHDALRRCAAARRGLGREGRHGHQFGAAHLAPAAVPAAARRGAAGLADHLRRRRAAWALPRPSTIASTGRDLPRARGAVGLRERRRAAVRHRRPGRHRPMPPTRILRRATGRSRRKRANDADRLLGDGRFPTADGRARFVPVRQEGTGPDRRRRLSRSPSTPAACATSGTR